MTEIVKDQVNREIVHSLTSEILKSNKVCTLGEFMSCAQEFLEERNYEFQKIMKVNIIKIFKRLKGNSAKNLLQQFNNSNFELNGDFLKNLSSLISNQKLTGVNLERIAEQSRIRADEVFFEIILEKLYQESKVIKYVISNYLSEELDSSKHLSQRRHRDVVFSLYQIMKVDNVKNIIDKMKESEFRELLHLIDKRVQVTYDLSKQEILEIKDFYKKHYRTIIQTFLAKIYDTDIAKKIQSTVKSPFKFLKKSLLSPFKSFAKKDSSKGNEIQELFSNFLPQPLACIVPKSLGNPVDFLQFLFINNFTFLVSSLNSLGSFAGLGFGLFPPIFMYTICISIIQNTHKLTSYDTEKQGGMHDYTPTKNVQIVCRGSQKEERSFVSTVNSRSITDNSPQLQR